MSVIVNVDIIFSMLLSALFVFVALETTTTYGADISEIYAEDIIASHGGSNGTLTASDFETYVNRLHNLSSHRNLVLVRDATDVNRLRQPLVDADKSQCYTPGQLLKLVVPTSNKGVDEPRRVDASTLLALCPVILQQLDNQNCSSLGVVDDIGRDGVLIEPSPLEVWGYGFLCVTLINMSAIFGAVLLPLMGKKFFNMLLVTLVGLAVGSLSSSAAFHLIPQAFGLVPKSGTVGGSHAYLWTSLLVLFGIYSFFMLERFLKIFIDFKKRQVQASFKRNLSEVEVLSYGTTVTDDHLTRRDSVNGDIGKDHQLEPITKDTHNHDHKIEFKQGKDSAIATVAWMIVFGDGLHNFIDGLSIGAAFNESILTGISISVAVICEELPHELGDLAVLLNSGMTVKQALLYNFLSALTCYVGLIIGTLLGELAEASMCIFAIAAGVFLYISLVDMVPEMNEEVENASQESVWEALKVIGLQNVGWITGTCILFTLAYYSDKLTLE